MNKTLPLLALAIGIAGAAQSSTAMVIDFESLKHDDASVVDAGYLFEQGGFQLENSADFPFDTLGISDPDFSGSTALINDNDGGVTRLSRIDGGYFALISIDLAELSIYDGGTYRVEFAGTTAGGGTVNQAFALDVLPGAQTFYFGEDFTQLTSVSWANTADYHQFDNIEVVPEPTTLAVTLAGLFVMGMRGRRADRRT